MPAAPSIPLPRNWSKHAKSALLHAIALARTALIEVWSGFENGPLVSARQAARVARLEFRVGILQEELRIKDARLARIAPQKRPHYPPSERLAILQLRAAAGWNAAETARRFGLSAGTIASWTRRIDDAGPDALVQTKTPVNRFPDFVRELVGGLKPSLPGAGRRRVAAVLARAGLHLAPTTIRRILQMRSKLPPPAPSSGVPGAKSASATGAAKRVVTARYPHHVWHVDLSVVPTAFGFWVPWLPRSFALGWPFSYWIGVVLDHSSRAVVATLVVKTQPNAHLVCAMLDRAVAEAGKKPRHIISDQGAQFQNDYLAWCARNGALPRFGAIGQSGSIAVIERFFRSIKYEFLRCILVPWALPEMSLELDAYVRWYNTERPHSSLGGATPAERLKGGLAACELPGIEARTRYPLERTTGPPRERLRGKVAAVVTHVEGRSLLPIIELRAA